MPIQAQHPIDTSQIIMDLQLENNRLNEEIESLKYKLESCQESNNNSTTEGMANTPPPSVEETKNPPGSFSTEDKQALEEKIRQLEEKLAKASLERDKCRDDHGDLQSRLNDALETNRENDQKILTLEDENNRLQKSVNTLSMEFEEIENNLSRCQEQNNDLVNEQTQKNSEISNYLQQLEDLKKELEIQQSTFIQMQTATDSLIQIVHAKDGEISTATNQLSECHSTIQQMNSELDDANREMNELESEMKSLRESIKQKEIQLEEKENRSRQMNDELEMQKDALLQCKEQLFDAENLLDGAIEKPKEKEHQQN